jgi:hypothetical protein
MYNEAHSTTMEIVYGFWVLPSFLIYKFVIFFCGGRNYIMRSLMICTPYPVFFR